MGKMKSNFLRHAVIYICIILFFVINLTSCVSQSPYDFLQTVLQGEPTNVPVEFLHSTELQDDKYAVFYLNQNNHLVCAIIKRHMNSYKILDVNGELSLTSSDSPFNIYYSSYSDRKKRYWIHWGIVLDDTIQKISNQNIFMEIVKLNNQNFRLVYLHGDESNLFDSFIYEITR